MREQLFILGMKLSCASGPLDLHRITQDLPGLLHIEEAEQPVSGGRSLLAMDCPSVPQLLAEQHLRAGCICGHSGLPTLQQSQVLNTAQVTVTGHTCKPSPALLSPI